MICKWFKKTAKKDTPRDFMQFALDEADKFGDRFGNYNYIAFCNLGINSKDHRFWIYDKAQDLIMPFKTSHGSGGKNSRPNDGWCREVANVSGSHKSCIGVFKCAEDYIGKNGRSLRLDGLSDTNSRARSRWIVIHKHSQMNNVVGQISPRSWGCFMFSEDDYERIIDMLQGGSALVVVYNK